MGIESMDYLSELGIEKIGFEEDGKYIVELETSNDYQEIFEILLGNEKLELDEESVEFNDEVNAVAFKDDKYILKLVANFKDETYTLEVREVE